jgi:hypothetical protein
MHLGLSAKDHRPRMPIGSHHFMRGNAMLFSVHDSTPGNLVESACCVSSGQATGLNSVTEVLVHTLIKPLGVAEGSQIVLSFRLEPNVV